MYIYREKKTLKVMILIYYCNFVETLLNSLKSKVDTNLTRPLASWFLRYVSNSKFIYKIYLE